MEQNTDLDFPTVLSSFLKSKARFRAIRGPVGSGKSVACATALMMIAANQKPGQDGIRRTRMVVTRNTLQQLKSTCLPTIQQVLRPIMNWKVSDSTIQIRAGDIHSDWILLPLDNPDNVQRLLSLELTAAWASEFREIQPDIINSLFSRCGRYPSKLDGGPTFYGIVQETNSFSEDSPWFDKLETDALPITWDYFIQPGGLEIDAENLENLPDTYYRDMVDSNPPEWVEQYVHNRITPSLSGQAVFRNSFDATYHVFEGLVPSRGHPLIIGLDMARHPAAIIGQINHLGEMLIMGECYAENMGVEKFVQTVLYPYMQQEKFAGLPSFIVGDPSGVAKGQIGERSTFDMLKDEGFQARPAQTNNIEPRLRAVDKWLLRSHGKTPVFMIDKSSCPQMVLALGSKYRYKIRRDGELEDKPDKGHPESDLADALQYLCLGTAHNILGRIMRPRGVEPAKFTAEAWT